jgi:predicted rRNA methylase YqxC with S4 and FtsJ domains
MGMPAKNVYGSDYGMNQTALRLSKNGNSKVIFRFNV